MSKGSKDLIIVGVITGAHGVRGEVRIKSFTAEPDALFDYAPFLDAQGKLLIDPLSARAAKDHFVVTPRKAEQKEVWDARKGTTLHVPRSRLPQTEEDEFYIDQLVGLQVFTGGDSAVGTIHAVLDHGAGDLLEIAPFGRGKTVLVPFTAEDVPVVDLAAGRIVISSFDLWADDTQPDDDPEAEAS